MGDLYDYFLVSGRLVCRRYWKLFGLLDWLIAFLVGTHPRVAIDLLYVLVLG